MIFIDVRWLVYDTCVKKEKFKISKMFDSQFCFIFRYSLPVRNQSLTGNSDKYFTHLFVNLLKPTGHVLHQQINIQQLYVLPTLYLCVLYLSENKQRLVPLTA